MMDCESLKEQLEAGFNGLLEVRQLGDEQCIVILPFWDEARDPITVCVSANEGSTVINDGGSIAGILFSLGQHEETTPAFKLLESLRRSHGLELDFGEGLVQLPVNESDIYDGVAEMAKVVMAMRTVTPHIRVSRPTTRSYGPRLRSKITRQYRQMKVLNLVQRRHRIDGARIERWPIDFHWSFGANGESKSVHVVVADLAVAEPMDKAQKVVALSLDTRELHSRGRDLLRIVIETDRGHSGSAEAGEFLRFHREALGYDLFDFRVADESADFYRKALNELMERADEQWKDAMEINGCS